MEADNFWITKLGVVIALIGICIEFFYGSGILIAIAGCVISGLGGAYVKYKNSTE